MLIQFYTAWKEMGKAVQGFQESTRKVTAQTADLVIFFYFFIFFLDSHKTTQARRDLLQCLPQCTVMSTGPKRSSLQMILYVLRISVALFHQMRKKDLKCKERQTCCSKASAMQKARWLNTYLNCDLKISVKPLHNSCKFSLILLLSHITTNLSNLSIYPLPISITHIYC